MWHLTLLLVAKIKISISCAEITIEFTDLKDLEEQLQKIDLAKIESLLKIKKYEVQGLELIDDSTIQEIPKSTEDLGTINLLKVSDGGESAVKLAVFLAANGLNQEEIKKVTGITILSS